jgi:hypothetical protein
MKLNGRRTVLHAAALSCLLAGPALGASQRLELTVSAGKHDRSNTPVRVLLSLPSAVAEAKAVTLADADGKSLPAQLAAPGLLRQSAKRAEGTVMRDLHFILPSLKEGESLKLTATVSTDAPPAGESFSWAITPNEFAELRYGKRPVLRYMCKPLDPKAREQTYKVFHHLYNPAGTQIVTKGPGGKYSHHRGLFFGFNRISYAGVKRVDTWHCGGSAHQSHEGFLAQEVGPVLGRHTVAVHWHGPGERVFAKEKREMTVYNVPGGTLVEFATRLASTVGQVKLDGDPQHAGFQFRASNEVAAKTSKLTYYLRPDGKGKLGGTRNWPGDKRCVNLPWNAMSFVVGGKRYTAVYLDKPTNPKEARYSERNYGRFGSYFEYQLDEGKDLEPNYRIWLQDGEMTIPQAVALRADFVEPPAVVVAD